MALDIHVMPIWRFKIGDFSSPLEKVLGRPAKTVTPGGLLDLLRSPRGWLDRRRARRETEAIRRAVVHANGCRVDWADDGPAVYSEQVPGGTIGLRAFAAWLQCRDRLPQFSEPPDRDYYKHEVWGLIDPNRSGSHLIRHCCSSGYFLPVDFAEVVQVEPFRIHSFQFSNPVGSSLRLQRDLEAVAGALQSPEIAAALPPDSSDWLPYATAQMREVAALSLRHGLPIIFHG